MNVTKIRILLIQRGAPYAAYEWTDPRSIQMILDMPADDPAADTLDSFRRRCPPHEALQIQLGLLGGSVVAGSSESFKGDEKIGHVLRQVLRSHLARLN